MAGRSPRSSVSSTARAPPPRSRQRQGPPRGRVRKTRLAPCAGAVAGSSLESHEEPPLAEGFEDWNVPPEARPEAQDYDFNLERALSSVVALTSRVPSDAFTA